MAKTFFRIQGKGISLEDMQAYQSTDVDDTQYDGLCCADSVDGLRGYMEWFGNDDEHEIVIFEGRQTGVLYDGWVAEPLREIARTSVSDFLTNDDWYNLES